VVGTKRYVPHSLEEVAKGSEEREGQKIRKHILSTFSTLLASGYTL
jgi:predicted GNAT superfamily acetyltransferase